MVPSIQVMENVNHAQQDARTVPAINIVLYVKTQTKENLQIVNAHQDTKMLKIMLIVKKSQGQLILKT